MIHSVSVRHTQLTGWPLRPLLAFSFCDAEWLPWTWHVPESALEWMSKELCPGASVFLCENMRGHHAKGRKLPRVSFQQGNGCFRVPFCLSSPLYSVHMQSQCLWSVATQAMSFCFSWQKSGSSSWLCIDSIPVRPHYRRHTHLLLLLAICPPFCGFLNLLVQRYHGSLGLYFWSLQVVKIVPVPSGLRTIPLQG